MAGTDEEIARIQLLLEEMFFSPGTSVALRVNFAVLKYEYFLEHVSNSSSTAASSSPFSVARAGSARAAALDAEPALCQRFLTGHKKWVKAWGAQRGSTEGCTVLLAALILEHPHFP